MNKARDAILGTLQTVPLLRIPECQDVQNILQVFGEIQDVQNILQVFGDFQDVQNILQVFRRFSRQAKYSSGFPRFSRRAKYSPGFTRFRNFPFLRYAIQNSPDYVNILSPFRLPTKQVAHLEEVQTLFTQKMLKEIIFHRGEKQLEKMPIPNCYEDVPWSRSTNFAMVMIFLGGGSIVVVTGVHYRKQRRRVN